MDLAVVEVKKEVEWRTEGETQCPDRYDRGCAKGTTSRCVAFLAVGSDVREIEIFGKMA